MLRCFISQKYATHSKTNGNTLKSRSNALRITPYLWRSPQVFMSLEPLFRDLRRSIPLQDMNVALRGKHSIQIEQCSGSLAQWIIASLAAEQTGARVVLVPTHEEALFIKADLEAFGLTVLTFQPTHVKPYDDKHLVDATVLVERSESLEAITKTPDPVLVVSAEALFDKVPAPAVFESASLLLKQGDEFPPEQFREKLVMQGYRAVNFVDEPGEFAYRGGILDVYAFTGNYPVRFEFFGNTIDSIREFDPNTQRSVSFLTQARLVPNLSAMKSAEKRTVLSFLPAEITFFVLDEHGVRSEIARRFAEAEKIWQGLENRDAAGLPEDHFTEPEALDLLLQTMPRVRFGGSGLAGGIDTVFVVESRPHPQLGSSMKLLRETIGSLSKEGFTTWILCDNDGQRERFEELLGDSGEAMRYRLQVSTLWQGFIYEPDKIAVFTDHQIFNRYLRPKTASRQISGGISLKELRDLHVGDFVVHVDHGIGRFEGFKIIRVNDARQEAVVLRYKDDSTLYVNVSNLHKLQKYSGKDGAEPPLTKLGSGEWQKKKAKTKSRLKDIARELIELYARRKAMKAYAFAPDKLWQIELEASFPWEETPDQMKAIEAVKADMEAPVPMDRLICGDVGFGKTEVAVRAAFKAVMDQKQVAMLVPTTILADQHYKTFAERMKDFPVRVAAMSRFKSPQEQKQTLEDLQKGKVDILIGTHRIVSKDIQFKDLGLLIIDEEQRFGVGTKEKLRGLKATVDTLTMTATPIPRTLNLSLMGARDLSTITTPPPNRQPVQTEIHSWDSRLIRDAIMQEISRGGQVFFIHNRVQNIEEMAGMIRELVPDVRIQWAHGQMSAQQLEHIITDFYDHKYDVLVSTNIVESGLDIPNANTIIINRANHFGLSELHQLRGRVGRSNRKAFCYLITPDLRDLSVESRKRLSALVEFSTLGSGFNIAMRDLDIRGAGDVLGGEQSGFINDIGFDLYMKILDDAVKEIKVSEFSNMFEDVKIEIELPETQVEFDSSALLEPYYVSDPVERLNLYRKLAQCTNEEQIQSWKTELIDRFGKLPEAASNLIEATLIKLYASPLFAVKATIRAGKMWLQLPADGTETGKVLYAEGRFQALLALFEDRAKGRYRIVQKDNAMRIVVDGIHTLPAATEFLKMMQHHAD
jgi:transcription-repair coupling factor (superfamily II helicase)